jgi:hypothetical protein
MEEQKRVRESATFNVDAHLLLAWGTIESRLPVSLVALALGCLVLGVTLGKGASKYNDS